MAEPTNSERAERGMGVLAAYENAHGGGDRSEETLRDVLADLMHWCDANGIDFDVECERAYDHHLAEVAEAV